MVIREERTSSCTAIISTRDHMRLVSSPSSWASSSISSPSSTRASACTSLKRQQRAWHCGESSRSPTFSQWRLVSVVQTRDYLTISTSCRSIWCLQVVSSSKDSLCTPNFKWRPSSPARSQPPRISNLPQTSPSSTSKRRSLNWNTLILKSRRSKRS